MRTDFAHRPKAIARLARFAIVAILLTLPGAQSANAAPACSSAGTISEAQRKSLQQLPVGLRAVLQAVRAQKQTSCKAPEAGFEQTDAVDPLSIALTPAVPAGSSPARAVPDEVVAIVTGDGANIDALATANGLSVRSRRQSLLLGGFIVRFGIDDGRTPDAVTAILATNPAIESPAPNHIYQLQQSSFEEARFAPGKIGLPLKGLNLSGKDIVIGVIDTAIDADHPDLQGAVIDSFDALAGQAISNRRHGTAVAGLIAGRKMIKGVAPQAKLLVARAFDDRGSADNKKASATSYQLIDALDWTVLKGARIINMSFTGPRNLPMGKALAAAAKKNILLIAAAGNNGPQAPAAYPAAEPSVLAVTATDIDNKIYRHANTGQYVFVAAPGVDVLAAAPDKGIDMVSGTSFAAPFLSGLAALMLEQDNKLTPRQFARRLELSAIDLGKPGRDSIFGVGLADLAKALRQQ